MKKIILLFAGILFSMFTNATELKTLVQNNPELGKAIEASLIRAHKKAIAADLNNIDKLVWPNNLDEYYNYLDDFSKWIPTEGDINSRENYDQEILIKLCHFYWLINDVQDIPEFSNWLLRLDSNQ